MEGVPQSVQDKANDLLVTMPFLQELLRLSCASATLLVELTQGSSYEIKATEITSPAWLGGLGLRRCIDAKEASLLLAAESDADLAPLGYKTSGATSMYYKQVFATQVSKDGASALMELRPSFDATSRKASDFTRAMWRDIQPAMNANANVNGQQYKWRVHHWSELGEILIAGDAMDERLTWVAPATLIAMFVFAGIATRSAAMPFILCFTVIVPVVAMFGLAVWVYQQGVIDFLNWDMFHSQGGLPYYLICTGLPLLLGTALAYTVLLFLRVRDHALLGRSSQRAVQKGLEDTAPAALTSGIFMAVAFFFLMLGSTAEIRELGFLFFFGVLVDTLLVRLCVTPSLLCLLGSSAFWPMQLPDANEINSADEEEEADKGVAYKQPAM